MFKIPNLNDPRFWDECTNKGRTRLFRSKMVTSCRDKAILEKKTMCDPSSILAWLEEKAEGMRRSRLKTMVSIVSGADEHFRDFLANPPDRIEGHGRRKTTAAVFLCVL